MDSAWLHRFALIGALPKGRGGEPERGRGLAHGARPIAIPGAHPEGPDRRGDLDGNTAGSDIDAGHVLGAVGVAAYEWDIKTDRLRWNDPVDDLLGVGDGSIDTGRAFMQRLDPAGPTGREAVILSAAQTDAETTGAGQSGVAYHIEYRIRCDDQDRSGQMLWIEDSGRWYGDDEGRPVRALGIIRIINDRRAREERLLYRSDHDELTGGLNRVRMIEEIDTAIADADRYQASSGFAVAAIDNLAVLNDAYGYHAADTVIAGVAARIRGEMRSGDAIGRLSGNKLGVVLRRCSEDDLMVAMRRFARAVGGSPIAAEPGSGGTCAIGVTVSIGGVVMPRHGRGHAEVLAHAHEALDSARSGGCAGLMQYEPSPRDEMARRRNAGLAGEIVSALNDGRIALAHQPIVSAKTGDVAFHEALCRLTLKDGSLLAASDFIETAERLGIVRMVDARALELAVANLCAVEDRTLSVNVSSLSALDGAWFSQLSGHIRRNRRIADRLIIELTETMAIADIERAVDFVGSIRDLGCRVAIDDFGSGHTSFKSLRQLGADIVKIDGAFIERISQTEDDQFFVATLVALARRIGLETVAEKVACQADADMLKTLGVDYLQGNLFGRAESVAPPLLAKPLEDVPTPTQDEADRPAVNAACRP